MSIRHGGGGGNGRRVSYIDIPPAVVLSDGERMI